MEYSSNESKVAAVVSGVAAAYWVFFTIVWIRGYLRARKESIVTRESKNDSLALANVPFHLGAIALQVLSIAFFGSNSVYEAFYPQSDVFGTVNWVCYSFYLSAVYLTGMSFILGFSTLYVNIPRNETVVLWVTTLLVLAICLTELVASQTARYIEAASLLIIFVIGIFLGCRTICTMKRRIMWSRSHSYDDYTVALLASRKKLSIVLGLFSGLFVECTVFEVLNHSSVEKVGKVSLWVALSGTAVCVNSWVLRLMRPNHALMDVEIISNHLKMLNDSREEDFRADSSNNWQG